MGNRVSKTVVLSYDSATKRITPEELDRLQTYFKRKTFSGSDLLSEANFKFEILSPEVTDVVANTMFVAFGGIPGRGLGFKDLLCNLVVLTKGTPQERAQFLFNLLSEDGVWVYGQNASVQFKKFEGAGSTDTRAISELNMREKFDFNEFLVWAMKNQEKLQLLQWILEQPPTLTDDRMFQTFYQTLAGITHLDEKEIRLLEERYFACCDPSIGKINMTRFKSLVSPPLHPDLIAGLFCAFDENGDSVIDFKEIVCGISACCRGPVAERQKFCFKIFDTNCDHLLTRHEVDQMLDLFAVVNYDENVVPDLTIFDHAMTALRTRFTHDDAGNEVLSFDNFLLWSSENFINENFLSLLNQVCHVVFGLRPQRKTDELTIINNWIEREARRGYVVDQTWYILANTWFGNWKSHIYSTCTNEQLAGINQYPSMHFSPLNSETCSRSSTPSAYTADQDSKAHSRRISNGSSVVAYSGNGDVVITGIVPISTTSTDSGIATDQVALIGVSKENSFVCTNPDGGDSGSEAGNADGFSKPSSISADSGVGVSGFGRQLRSWSPCPRPKRPQNDLSLAQPSTKNQKMPCSIDNGDLVNNRRSDSKLTCLTVNGGPLREPHLIREGIDYIVIPEPVWVSLVSWYGGGAPALPRTVIGGSEKAQTHLELYPIWITVYRHQIVNNGPRPSPPAFGMNVVAGLSAITMNAANVGMSYFSSPPKRIARYELAISRIWTVSELQMYMCAKLNLTYDCTRLWIMKQNDPTLLLEEETEKLETFLVEEPPQLRILLEVRNKDLTWPEEISQLATQKGILSRSSGGQPGYTGLNNLGNTCFLNAALQCVSSTQPFTQYFKRNVHVYELNSENNEGMKGKLATEFAKLINDLWSGSSKVIAPIKLKWLVGRYSAQFNDFQQHDSQELLSVLLDGLHEDLNRVTTKPYVELKDSDGRPDEVVAKEAWDNHIRRNRSVVVDLFHGLLRSCVRCGNCGHESVKFDPFSILSLPIPMDNFQLLYFTVVRLSGSIPTRVAIRARPDDTFKSIKQEISTLVEGNLTPDNMLMVEITHSSLIRSFLSDHRRVRSVTSISSSFYVYEIPYFPIPPLPDTNGITTFSGSGGASTLSPAGYARQNGTVPSSLSPTPPYHRMRKSAHSRTASEISMTSNDSEASGSTANNVASDGDFNFKGFRLAVHRRVERVESYFLAYRQPRPFIFNVPLVVPADNYFSDEASTSDSETSGSPTQPQFKWTGKRMYESVWSQVKRLVSPLPKQLHQYNHAQDGDETLYAEYPFVLRTVNRGGYFCSKCPWFRFCIGCMVDPTESTICYTQADNFIAIDWDITALHLRYQQSLEKVVNDHDSLPRIQALHNEPSTLESCLRAFTDEEALEGYSCSKCKVQKCSKKLDIWRLPPILIFHIKRFQCNSSQRWVKSTKTVDFPCEQFDPTCFVFEPEYDLSGSTSKSGATTPSSTIPTDMTDNSSSSPISNGTVPMEVTSSETTLNPGERIRRRRLTVADRHDHFLKPGTDPHDLRYDLYAVTCHFGMLGAGHYVSYAKHPNGNWVFHNDSSIKEVHWAEVEKKAAYLLFYERKDLDHGAYIPDTTGKEH